MVIASNLGFPRIGARRELKRALEQYWTGQVSQDHLLAVGRVIRTDNWQHQLQAGLTHIPSGDFSFYDHVLDTAAMVGAVPERFGWNGDQVDLDTYFAMARGRKSDAPGGGVAAMEMTKWFDTNYHYIVPELNRDQAFRLATGKAVHEVREAREAGIQTRPVLLGPVSFLLLSKPVGGRFDPLDLLERLLPVYVQVFEQLAAAGAEWIQLDEPCLVTELHSRQQEAYERAYGHLSKQTAGLKVLLATYFGDLRENLPTALSLPIEALHVDLVRAPGQLEPILAQMPDAMRLSMGLVDGRNIWIADLERATKLLDHAIHTLGPDRILLGPSCSLLHVPVDLDQETGMDEALRGWMAFARQKIGEIATLARYTNDGPETVREVLAANAEALERRRKSPRIHLHEVKQRTDAVDEAMMRRKHPYDQRRPQQQETLGLPLLPTTTIGSFPQTRQVRQMRARHRRGEIDAVSYENFLKEQVAQCVRFQEETGLDMLVHGEFERTDMVEYFGEKMTGFTRSKFGWVQSYGSRCVKPPIIYGDVSRPEPISVGWWRVAQQLTDRPVKGMLTGPVTILQWSFVRDDQPRPQTCRQIALAIRDEVADLEAAGGKAIQIDEPALREGMPLRRADAAGYLEWAVAAFRLASSGVDDTTQIHTHMCYAEFNDIIDSIEAMDADVLSIEASRSRMELLDAFAAFKYPNEVGPGLYDIHSPRVPPVEEMEGLLRRALEVLAAEQIWVNPDCGLKTRQWSEVREALGNMVKAAHRVREHLTAEKNPKGPT